LIAIAVSCLDVDMDMDMVVDFAPGTPPPLICQWDLAERQIEGFDFFVLRVPIALVIIAAAFCVLGLSQLSLVRVSCQHPFSKPCPWTHSPPLSRFFIAIAMAAQSHDLALLELKEMGIMSGRARRLCQHSIEAICEIKVLENY